MDNFHFAPQLEPTAVRDWLYACYELHVDSLRVEYEPHGDTVRLILQRHGHLGCVIAGLTRDVFTDSDPRVISAMLSEMQHKADLLPRKETGNNPTFYYTEATDD